MMDYRVRNIGDGWVSEYKKPYWTIFGIRYKWVHFISVAGMSGKRWVFSSEKMAKEETLNQIKYNIINNR